MGNYTKINIDLKLDLPATYGSSNGDPHSLYDLLTDLADDCPPNDLPDHPFFENSRFLLVFANTTDDSEANSERGFTDNTLKLRCDIKNYGYVLEEFLDWISPYVLESTLGSWQTEQLDDIEPAPFFWHDGDFYLARSKTQPGYLSAYMF